MNQFKFILLAVGFGFFFGILAATWQPLSGIFTIHHKNDSLADAAASAAPSVVNIFTSTINHPLSARQDNINPHKSQLRKGISLGSGVIVDSSGLIMTNLHVLKKASAISIQLHDGRRANASIVGIDEATDLALIKVEMNDISPIFFGDSDIMRVGDKVLAIGNPFGFGQTVTQGIISAKGRYGLNLNTYENFIQTDAAVNTGSSGGALINSRGQLIGMTSANYTRTGGSLGIALATPVEIITKVLRDIVEHGFVVRGWIGLEVTQITTELAKKRGFISSSGVMVTFIHPQSPAASAGIKPGDIITAINNKPISTGHDGLLEVAEMNPGTTVKISLVRDQKNITLETRLGIRPINSKR